MAKSFNRDASRRYHDRVARQYDSIYDDPYWEFHDELTWRQIKPWVPRDATAHCVDLGCGTGKWGLKLLKSGFPTTFVDHAAAMIEQVRPKLEALGPKGNKGTLLVADIVEMPAVPSDDFQLVLAMGRSAVDLLGCQTRPAARWPASPGPAGSSSQRLTTSWPPSIISSSAGRWTNWKISFNPAEQTGSPPTNASGSN